MRTLLASIALATAGVSTAVPAQSIDQPFVATISYADLNLDSAAGKAAFEGRVKVVANRYCHDLTISPIAEVVAVADCRASMMSAAQRQLGRTASRSPKGTLLAAR
jgi:UrcA family protein